MSITRVFGFWTVTDVCLEAGVARNVIERQMKRELVPRPSHPAGNSRRLHYTTKEAQKIVATLKAIKTWKTAR